MLSLSRANWVPVAIDAAGSPPRKTTTSSFERFICREIRNSPGVMEAPPTNRSAAVSTGFFQPASAAISEITWAMRAGICSTVTYRVSAARSGCCRKSHCCGSADCCRVSSCSEMAPARSSAAAIGTCRSLMAVSCRGTEMAAGRPIHECCCCRLRRKVAVS